MSLERFGSGLFAFLSAAVCVSYAATPADFVRLRKADFSIKIQMAPGAPKECVLLRDVAQALSRVQQATKLMGLSLRVLECYRPFSFSPSLAESERDALSRGTVVEAIFVEPSDSPVALPSPHDQAIILSAKPYKKSEARKNAAKLTELMKREGFERDPQRWWRFTWSEATNLAIHDFSIDAVSRR